MMYVSSESLISDGFRGNNGHDGSRRRRKNWTSLENLCWLCSFGLKLCPSVDLDEENSDLMSVSSESLNFGRFRWKIRRLTTTKLRKITWY